MIDLKVTTIGGPEIARQLEAGPGAIRAAIRNELADIGDEIVSQAQSNAPKKTGIMASRIVWYFGIETTSRQRRKMGVSRTIDPERGPVLFTVRPTGTIAHLIERGVHGPRKAHQRRVTRTGTVWMRKGKKTITARGVAFVKAHAFSFPARPFFMPAVASVGGASGVNERLQKALETTWGAG